MDELPKKTIQINPEFLKLPMRGGKTRKKRDDAAAEPKPIKIRSDKKTDSEKTIKRRAINYIRRQQEDRYKRLMKGLDEPSSPADVRVEPTDPTKTYADNFKSDFDDSLAFLQKLADQSAQKIPANTLSSTLKQYPVLPNSTLFQNPILNTVLDENVSLVEPEAFRIDATPSSPSPTIKSNIVIPPPPMYGCLKGGKLPTYRTLRQVGNAPPSAPYGGASFAPSPSVNAASASTQLNAQQQHPTQPTPQIAGSLSKLTPEQQRAELKQFIEKRKEEKRNIERIKRQRQLLKPHKKQKRTTTRTYRVGKSKHYPRVGVLISNKTIRTQILAKKQKIRETPIEDIRKYLIKKGLIRVGSSCPNDVLRKMYESSMLMCGELQNHNPDNLLYNYLHNAI